VNESAAQVLDGRVLEELRASVEGDRGFVVDLIEAYLVDGEAHVADVEAAIAAGDLQALVRPAHTLKSSSATVGATRLASLARALEFAGRDASAANARTEHATALRAAWTEAAEALRSWIERDEA
jgi:HPt (histidine-containing phosphotransfer) domain-containing protein